MSTPAQRINRNRGRLLWRIRRRFQTVTQTHLVGGQSFSFTRVTNPDVVLDEIIEAEDRREKLTGRPTHNDELHLPYWAELWDSALGIGEVLVKAGHAHGRALDLGCGMGFAGMIAAAVGYEVLLADLEEPALLFARLNAGGVSERVRARRLDWRVDRIGERFDLIIGADVLYDRTQWVFLEPFWRAHLAADGTVLLGEPGRQTGDLFADWIEPRGWQMERFEQPVSTRERAIRLFRLTARQ